MPIKELAGIFPKLAANKRTITSPIDPNYNCHAWATGDNSSWYEPYGVILPNPFPPYQWPEGLPHDQNPQTFIEFFRRFGFEVAEGSDLEAEFEKIALYIRSGEVQHTARLLSSGVWTSKIGKQEDIQHSLSDLESDNPYGYGIPSIFLKRRL